MRRVDDFTADAVIWCSTFILAAVLAFGASFALWHRAFAPWAGTAQAAAFASAVVLAFVLRRVWLKTTFAGAAAGLFVSGSTFAHLLVVYLR